MRNRSSLLIIFLVVLIDLIGFGIVIPILPYYAQAFGASGWELGWLMAVYSLMQFIFSPFWGRISDRVGRKPVLLFTIAGTAGSLAILGLADSLEWLFIGRTLAGFFGANISTAYAYVTDVTDEKNRARGMGLIGAGFGIGFIIGPAIGGILSRYGYSFPMFAGAALASLNLIFAVFKLEEPLASKEIRASNRVERFSLKTWQAGLKDPRTRFAILIFFLLTVAVTQLEVTFAIYMGLKFGFDAFQAGWLLAMMGFIMALVQGGLIGKLARRFGENRLILSGSAIAAIGLTAFASSITLPMIIASLIVLAVGHGVLHPSLSSLASLGAESHQRGMVMGVFQSAGSLARIFGPPLAGALYDSSATSPFFTGSGFLLVAFLLSAVWSRSTHAADSRSL